jgi:hypothetical protein
VKCVSKTGVCPVLGCEQDGECYIERCERTHMTAPSPVTNDDMLAHFAELLLTVNAARLVA